ncbi:MAG: dihydrodipicolinate synthase family protein, partial [Candidatus Eremiobacteraeota bacterium]|nr:dihydrodipicolinate synthase family protein [Candidatus Eremiobacteraeota bacterium]
MKGVIAAVLTPLRDDGTPHIGLMLEHCRWLIGSGCDGLAILGTTGEANSLSLSERERFLEGVVRGAGIPVERIIAGTGCCSVADSVRLSRHALSLGVVRLLVLPPFYYKKVSNDGLFEAYGRLIEGVADARTRLYLYNIPQMTGIALDAALICSLIDKYDEIIAGIKDSSGDWPSLKNLCALFGRRMDVFAGSERDVIDAVDA